MEEKKNTENKISKRWFLEGILGAIFFVTFYTLSLIFPAGHRPIEVFGHYLYWLMSLLIGTIAFVVRYLIERIIKPKH